MSSSSCMIISGNMSNECVVNCPLCMEEMDPTDKHLKPCKCGYESLFWYYRILPCMVKEWVQRCDRPDCLYVHDVCAQEDICTKDDVASTCTSKLQKSSGSTSNSLVSRSGSMLPPPMDTSCSSSSSTGGKVLPESLAHEGDARKSSALPPTASWASAPTSSRLSYASVTVSQGPLDHSHMPSNLIIKATDSRAQIPASSQNVNQSDDGTFKSSHSMMVTNGPVNESALFQRHTVTEFEEHTGLRNFWASDLANIGIKSAACRSSCENYDNDTVQKIRSNQQLSVASANDFIRSSIMDKTRVNSSYYFCSPVNRSYQGSDCVDAIGVGLSSDEFFGTINIQDATIPNLQARSHGSLLNVASATRVHAPCQNKLSGCLDEVLTESLNKVKSSTVDVDNNYCTTTSSTANPLILDGSAVGSSTCQDVGFNSFLYSQGKLLNNSSCANEDFEYLYRRPPLLEKGISNLNFGDSPEAAWKEYDIMSDILSLDLAHDDHLIGSSLARHFADNGRSNYPAICDSKTCFNGNNSLYAFQRMDNFDHAKTKSCFTESNISNVKYCGQLDDVKKFATHIYACRVDNFLPVSHFNEHNSDNSQHSLFSTDIASESKTLFICESASNSKLKGSQIKPTPGFHPEVADNPDPLFLSSPIYGQLISPKSGPSTVDFTRGEHMSSRLRNFVENPVGLANESTSSMMNNLYWQTGGNDYDISGTSYTTGSFTASVSEVRESGFPDIINSLIPGSKYGSLRWSV
ncbi:hypothetical protein Cni_G10815 [Canna indica]|uniref:RNA binding (RRM/RBD/RNP motifs) family protein n=1 Tax=Canna indica TaxID=4628 RepID=A0AAQ3KAK4_9LILI|nr:hypothetical protein Cni_G10815 [Canna indica]